MRETARSCSAPNKAAMVQMGSCAGNLLDFMANGPAAPAIGGGRWETRW